MKWNWIKASESYLFSMTIENKIAALSIPAFVLLVSARCICSSLNLALQQYFFFGRNIGKVTPKISYFHYLKKSVLNPCIKKTFYFILKTEALL